MSEENKNLNTISEDTANADSNAVAETADKKEDTKAKKNKKNKSEKGRFKKFMKSRKAKHGTVAMAITALVIVMVIIVNIIVGLLVNRFPDLELDLTSNKSFALQDDTIDYVSHLDKDVTVNILMAKESFESQGTYFVQAQKMLNKMASKSDGKMKIKYVDLTSTRRSHPIIRMLTGSQARQITLFLLNPASSTRCLLLRIALNMTRRPTITTVHTALPAQRLSRLL